MKMPLGKVCNTVDFIVIQNFFKAVYYFNIEFFGIFLCLFFQIPCQDVVWRYVEPTNESGIYGIHSTMAKCSSDAARHRGIRRNGNEAFGCCGPKDNMWLFSARDMKWYLDWLFVRGVNLIYPHAFFYSVNPPRSEERPPDVGFNSYWWNNYHIISKYIKRMCWLLTDSVNTADTAILCDKYDLPYNVAKTLYQNQIEFNYLEKELLVQSCRVENSHIIIQNQKYRHLIIEDFAIVDKDTLGILKEFENQGVNIFVRYGSEQFITLTSDDDILNYTVPSVNIYPPNKDLRAGVIVKDSEKYIILTNEGENEICGRLSAEGMADADIFNPVSGEICEYNGFISLKCRESRILHIKSEYQKLALRNWTVNGKSVKLTSWTTWSECRDFCGSLEYETDFCLEEFSQKVSILFEKIGEMLELFVNGNAVPVTLFPPYCFDITDFVNSGNNKIKARVTNSTAARFTDARPDSGIMGNVFLHIKYNNKNTEK